MRRRHFGLLLLTLAVCTSALADSDDVPPEVATKIRSTLHERIPEVHVEGIHRGPIPGMYEVDTGEELVYSNDTGTLIFAGRLIDTKSRRDLAAERWNALHTVDFNSLPFDLAIKTVRGDGSRKLAIFADPFCPYCAQLEQQMQGVNNVTLYTFLYPIETLHPGAGLKSAQIWCSKDRSSAWSKWILQKQDPGDTRCQGAPVEQLRQLGEKLRVDSTPTLFTVDGKRVRGAIKHNEIEQLLAEAHK